MPNVTFLLVVIPFCQNYVFGVSPKPKLTKYESQHSLIQISENCIINSHTKWLLWNFSTYTLYYYPGGGVQLQLRLLHNFNTYFVFKQQQERFVQRKRRRIYTHLDWENHLKVYKEQNMQHLIAGFKHLCFILSCIYSW